MTVVPNIWDCVRKIRNEVITRAAFAERLWDEYFDKDIEEIATKYDKTIPQVILRWHIQKGVVPIPKATSVARQIQNKEVFDFTLEHEDIEKINTLTQKDGRLKGQDPAVYEEF